MKSLTHCLVALSLLTFSTAPFAQDEADEGGGWFSGVTSFFSNLFSSDDEADQPAAADDGSSPGGTGGLEWYVGADGGVTKHESKALRVARGSYSAYAGGIFQNRLGFELGYLDLGKADVKGAPGVTLAVDGYRGMLTFNTEAGDAPVRLGVGYYSLDSTLGGASESSSGLTLGFKFEQAVTEHMYLTLGTDFLLGNKLGGEKSDAIMFGIGLSFHTSPPMAAAADEDDGVGVTEPAYEEAPVTDENPAGEPSTDEPAAAEPPVEEPATDEPVTEEPVTEEGY